MSTPSRDSGAGAKGKRTVALALVVLVGASGVLGSLFYKQGQANRGNYARAEQIVPDIAPALQEARLKKAQALREKWKGWALEHKGILKKMLSGGQSEQEVVWQALPSVLNDPKVTSIMLDDVNNSLTPYTWDPVSRGAGAPGSGLTEEQRAGVNSVVKTHLSNDFQQYHDIKMSSSTNAGAKTIGLWASGRITETETVDLPHVKGQPTSEEVTRELVPPYDFLS